MKDSKKVMRWRHSVELKALVLAECAQDGASVASVALSHGINANVVHKWRRLAGAASLPVASFVPVALPAPTCAAPADIRMELRKGATSMTITWPAAAAGDCAAWMRELPDRRTPEGWRDYTLLLFLYNCGARVSETAGLRWDDLQLTAPRQVRLRGKGRKERLLPLWRETASALHRLRALAPAGGSQCVFVSRHGQPLTRDGIAYVLRKHAAAAAKTKPVLQRKRITPHVLRHSCAVALLQSGTDVTVIRDYLGHASVATTGRYITINLKMKREAMEAFWQKAGIGPATTKAWKPKADLLAFLQSL